MSAIEWRVQRVIATPSIWEDEEVSDREVTDLVHGGTEDRAMGALEAGSSSTGDCENLSALSPSRAETPRRMRTAYDNRPEAQR